MTLADGRYFSCYECNSYTPVAEAYSDMCCNACSDAGKEDPYATVKVEIYPCPDPSGVCDSEEHHFGHHKHERELDG